jgi:putative FmdB family regulatory protein
MWEKGGPVPFYRYECEACGEVFRVLHRNGDDADVETTCPQCGSERATRLLPRIGVIYKGSGYYSTDYRSKKARSAKDAKTDGSESASNGGEVSSVKPTTKAERSEN